jgi:hypothetical protein
MGWFGPSSGDCSCCAALLGDCECTSATGQGEFDGDTFITGCRRVSDATDCPGGYCVATWNESMLVWEFLPGWDSCTNL